MAITDIIDPDHLQALRLGRIVYFGLHLKLFTHDSCYEYFAIFVKNVEACSFCLSIFENIQLPSHKRVFPSSQRCVDV